MRVGVMENRRAIPAEATRHELAGEAFEIWVSRSRDTLFATLLRILRDESEAEDLLQETYLRALSRLRSFRGEGDPIGWLRRIAVRLALNRLRAKRLRRWLPLFDEDRPGRAEPAGDLPGPDDRAESAERRQRLDDLLEGFPPKARAAFSLRILDDRPYEEIAVLVGCSEATARSLVSRTRSRLEEEIRKRGWNDEE